MLFIILVIAGYIISTGLTLIGLWLIILQRLLADDPATEAEIALLEQEAIKAKDQDEQALAWMRVSDAEHGDGKDSPIGWILFIIGLLLILAITALLYLR